MTETLAPVSSLIDKDFQQPLNSVRGETVYTTNRRKRTPYMPVVKNIRIFDQMETSAFLTFSFCSSSLPSFVGLSLERFRFTPCIRSDRSRRKSSGLFLLTVTYLAEVPPVVAEVAVGADVLTPRSQMARATSVECYLLNTAHLVCR